MTAVERGLYAILDAGLVAADGLATAAEAAFAGGAVMLQYRDKTTSTATRHANALRLRAIARAAGRPLIINDDPALAADIGADGVHLGRGDAAIEAARRQLGPDAIIGATCHASLAHAREAAAAGASYVSFGRFFDSATKPQAPPAAVDVLSRAKRELAVPIVAIGGVSADNGSRLLAAGADLLAVSAAVFAADDIRTAARRIAALFE